MGLFNKLFNGAPGPAEKKDFPWRPLTAVSQLDAILHASLTKPQAIFKHSTRCGISSMVKNQFERDFKGKEGLMELHYLDIILYRDVSNHIQKKFRIRHESPQLIIIDKKEVVFHASHGTINSVDLDKFV